MKKKHWLDQRMLLARMSRNQFQNIRSARRNARSRMDSMNRVGKKFGAGVSNESSEVHTKKKLRENVAERCQCVRLIRPGKRKRHI